MQLLESGEMYLETILILTIRDQTVRSIDIAKYMGFSKPSVSRAVGRLKEQGYITVDPEGKADAPLRKKSMSAIRCSPPCSCAWASASRPLPTTPARSSTTSATKPSRPSSVTWRFTDNLQPRCG